MIEEVFRISSSLFSLHLFIFLLLQCIFFMYFFVDDKTMHICNKSSCSIESLDRESSAGTTPHLIGTQSPLILPGWEKRYLLGLVIASEPMVGQLLSLPVGHISYYHLD